jgi:hypothetical protein
VSKRAAAFGARELWNSQVPAFQMPPPFFDVLKRVAINGTRATLFIIGALKKITELRRERSEY